VIKRYIIQSIDNKHMFCNTVMHGILIRVKTDVVRVSDVQGKNPEFRFL
jgi:hypothetical protein